MIRAVLRGGFFFESTMSDETAAPTDGATTEAPETNAATEAEKPEVAATESKPEGDAAEKPADQPDDEDTEQEGEKPKRASRTDRLKNRIRELEAEVEAERRSRGASPDAAKPPQEAEFNGDYEAFERARRQFDVKEAIREALREQTEGAQQKRERELRERQVELYRERVAEVKTTIPDFEQALASARDVQIRDDVGDFIRESDKGPFLAYHFAKNPQQLAEINQMTPSRAARELARIEARLSTPEPKRQTSAPPPARPLSGGAAPKADPSKMSMEEYVTWRAKREG
jgi:hypothetical protein